MTYPAHHMSANERFEFVIDVLKQTRLQHNPIACWWIPSTAPLGGIWAKAYDPTYPEIRPLDITVTEGEDPLVVAYGITGALQC